jgi:hypothetical protein
MSSLKREAVNIGTVSGGIVNFGGAVYIAPISITKSTGDSGGSNASASVSSSSGTGTSNQSQTQTRISEILGLIRTML